MGVNEEIAKAFGAHGLWKARIKQAIDSGQSEHSPEIVAKDDRCAFGKWLHGDSLGSRERDTGDYRSVVKLHASFHQAAGTTLSKALDGDRQGALHDLTSGTFASAANALSDAMIGWQKHAATGCHAHAGARFWRSCRFLLRGKVGARLWATIAIPTVAALAMVGYVDLGQLRTIREMEQLTDVAALISEISATTHELQKERGMSSALSARHNDQLAAQRKSQIEATDNRRRSLEAIIGRLSGGMPAPVAEKLGAVGSMLKKVDDLRPRVSGGDAKSPEILATFSSTINTLLSAAEEAMALTNHPEVTNTIGALINLSRAKEYAGLERATGATAIGGGTVDAVRKRIIELSAAQSERLAAVAAGLPVAQRAAMAEMLKAPATARFERERTALIEGDAGGLTADGWFADATARIDLFKAMEGKIIDGVAATTAAIGAQTWRVTIVFNGVTLALLLTGGVIVIILTRGITIPTNRLTEAMRLLASGQTDTKVPAVERLDEIGEMARAVLVFQQQAFAVEQMTAEREQQRQKHEDERRRAIFEMAERIESHTTEVVAHVSAEAFRIYYAAESMAKGAVQVEGNSQVVASAAAQSLATAQAVAGSTEELSASIREIATQVERTKRMVAEAVRAADDATATVAELSDAMAAVDQVIKVIADIASQTNLLALNATIEAARAGEAGKGFAVVAGEVKHLANQTAHQTDDISRRINLLKEMAGRVTGAIQGTVQRIQDVDAVAGAVAAAVGQQDSATKEIAGNVHQAAHAANEVASRIGAVAEEAGKTGNEARSMKGLMEAMAKQIGELGRVLTEVVRTTAPEADRRGAARIPMQARARVALPQGQFEGKLIDLSTGGASLAAISHGTPGENGTFTLDGVSVPFTVANRTGDTLHLKFTGETSGIREWLNRRKAPVVVAA